MSANDQHKVGRPAVWNCPTCKRCIRSKFCPDCGTERPDQQSSQEKSVDDLRLLAAHCRRVAQGKWNAYQTALKRGYAGDVELLTWEKYNRHLKSAEWAIEVITAL